MAKIDAHELGDWVRNRRRAKGLTQSVLAKRAGISRYHVIRIENGETTTRRATVSALAEALEAPEGDALLLAGFTAECSAAAEIGAHIADILEPLEPADRQAVVLQLREWARGLVEMLSRKGTGAPAGNRPHNSVLCGSFDRTASLSPVFFTDCGRPARIPIPAV